MKTFIQSVRFTLVFCAFLAVSYVFVLWGYGQLVSPNSGNAEVVTCNGHIVGAANVGQQFTKDIYFWGRPSNAGDGYDATSSSGSNKGPTNPEYLAEVNMRVDAFLAKHPYLQRADVPAEMVTASASGLDPHITPASAMVQVERVAKARGLDVACVRRIVEEQIESPFLGIFGPEKVNILRLNVALDEYKK